MNIKQKLKNDLPVDISHWINIVEMVCGKHKKRAVVVGGVVRDLVLSQPVHEADFMMEHPIDAAVDEIAKKLGGKVIKYKPFLTATLILGDSKTIDVVTARTEQYLAPGKLPIVSPATIEDDLKRRDFTVNAMACDIAPSSFGHVIDPFHGGKDILDKKIRVLHDKSFDDDPTRIYRCARFAGRLDFEVEYKTEKLILKAVKEGRPKVLSPVRLRHEFEKILMEPDPLLIIKTLEKWDVLRFIHPEMTIQKMHQESMRLQPSTPNDLNGRLVSWFKPWGKTMAEKMMRELAFEKQTKKEVLSQIP